MKITIRSKSSKSNNPSIGDIFVSHPKQIVYVMNQIYLGGGHFIISEIIGKPHINIIKNDGIIHNSCGPAFVHPECKNIWANYGEICELKESTINNFLILPHRKILWL
jgi:hypothetical protein